MHELFLVLLPGKEPLLQHAASTMRHTHTTKDMKTRVILVLPMALFLAFLFSTQPRFHAPEQYRIEIPHHRTRDSW